jgi:hypothetical protein
MLQRYFLQVFKDGEPGETYQVQTEVDAQDLARTLVAGGLADAVPVYVGTYLYTVAG